MSVLHTYRSDGFGGTKTGRLTPVRAIRQFCRECYGFAPTQAIDIRECPSEVCPLHPFRLGKAHLPARKAGKRAVGGQNTAVFAITQ